MLDTTNRLVRTPVYLAAWANDGADIVAEVSQWCEAINLKGNYGSHSMRKTFGYHPTDSVEYACNTVGSVRSSVTSTVRLESGIKRKGPRPNYSDLGHI